MNVPRFTAGASLYKSDVRYRATPEISSHGGPVRPASTFSEVFRPRPTFCLRTVCPFGQLWCHRAIGIWNPVTASCEGYVDPFRTF